MAAYSRMNLPGFVFSPEPVDPGELAAEAKERYLPLAKSRQVELQLALEPDLPEIIADAELLRQVFDNLLDNALAHTPAGGRVTIGVRLQGDRICIFMADTGPGVPDEHRERIFEPLYRVDPARNAATGGAGLGLAIARQIMDLHGGNIEYRQKENEAGFYFILNKEPLNQGGKK